MSCPFSHPNVPKVLWECATSPCLETLPVITPDSFNFSSISQPELELWDTVSLSNHCWVECMAKEWTSNYSLTFVQTLHLGPRAIVLSWCQNSKMGRARLCRRQPQRSKRMSRLSRQVGVNLHPTQPLFLMIDPILSYSWAKQIQEKTVYIPWRTVWVFCRESYEAVD